MQAIVTSKRVYYPNEPLENSWFLPNIHEIDSKESLICLCKCGRVFEAKSMHADILGETIVCPDCGNKTFLDTQTFITPKHFKYFKRFDWSYEVYTKDGCLHSTAFFYMPHVNGSDLSIQFDKEILCDLSVDCRGKIVSAYQNTKMLDSKILHDENFITIGSLVAESIAKNIAFLIHSTYKKRFDALSPTLDAMDTDVIERVEVMRFLLQYPDIKDPRLFYFNRAFLDMLPRKSDLKNTLDQISANKPKSVRRQVYKNAENFIKKARHKNRYDPLADVLFCSYFKDANLAVSLCGVPHKIKSLFFAMDNKTSIEKLFDLLFAHYEPVRIKNFLLMMIQEGTAKLRMWNDTIEMVGKQGFDEVLQANYTPHQLNLHNLHERILDFYIPFYEEADANEFEYAETQKRSQKYSGSN